MYTLIDESVNCRECKYYECVFGVYLCRAMCYLSEHPELDIHTVEIKDPGSVPDWCPIVELNRKYSALPDERRKALDTIADGLKMLNQILAEKTDLP